MNIHRSAAVGFGRAADAYERGRPAYPRPAVAFLVDRLGIGPGTTVIDLAAGTGKLTRMLIGYGATLVAVEPVAAMRELLAEFVPEIEILDGMAEALPVNSASADAVTVAQAFHWFRAGDALAEIHRVLRPGGGLGLIWNRRDRSQPLQAELERLVRSHRTDEPTYESGRWRTAMTATPLFTTLAESHFPHEQELDAGGVVQRVMSTSVMAALADDPRRAAEAQVRALAEAAPTPIRLRYTTDVFVYTRA